MVGGGGGAGAPSLTVRTSSAISSIVIKTPTFDSSCLKVTFVGLVVRTGFGLGAGGGAGGLIVARLLRFAFDFAAAVAGGGPGACSKASK